MIRKVYVRKGIDPPVRDLLVQLIDDRIESGIYAGNRDHYQARLRRARALLVDARPNDRKDPRRAS